jgi:hypothetical protein
VLKGLREAEVWIKDQLGEEEQIVTVILVTHEVPSQDVLRPYVFGHRDFEGVL